MASLLDTWGRVLELIERRIGARSFKKWLGPTTPLTVESKTLTVRVPSSLLVERIQFVTLIRDALCELGRSDLTVQVLHGAEEGAEDDGQIPNLVLSSGPMTISMELDPR